MFRNIGEKIKDISVFVTIAGIFISCIGGCVLWSVDESLIVTGIIIAVVGSLISWLSTVLLYGYGQLISNSDRIVEILESSGKERLIQKIENENMPEPEQKNNEIKANFNPKLSKTDPLESLKKWKDEGLITGIEYEQKLKELKK